MDMRPVYWMLCGASATLLTTAWANKQDASPSFSQSEMVAAERLPANLIIPQAVTSNALTLKRQQWVEPKSDPFARVAPEQHSAVLPVATGAVAQPIPDFSYVFIGRILAEEKNAVFLSKSGQIYGVVMGDVLDGVYRVERIGGDHLEITYLPKKTKLNYSFDSLVAKPISPTASMLSQADVPSAAPVRPQGAPQGMIGDVPSLENGQMTDDLKQMLAPSPPPKGDVMKMMGVTPPPQGDAMQMMMRPVQPGQPVPGEQAGSPAPVASPRAGQ